MNLCINSSLILGYVQISQEKVNEKKKNTENLPQVCEFCIQLLGYNTTLL